MNKQKPFSKIMAILLGVVMLIGMIPLMGVITIMPEECPHEHDESCGFVEAVPCLHDCNAQCRIQNAEFCNSAFCECDDPCDPEDPTFCFLNFELFDIAATSADVVIGYGGYDLRDGAGLTGTQVYFGVHPTTSQPILWYIVAKDSVTVTLWTTTNMGNRRYDPSAHNNWSSSEIARWLNGEGDFSTTGFVPNAFSPREQAAIAEHYGTVDESYNWGTIDSRQRIVLPSFNEVRDSGTWGLSQQNRDFGGIWWLRSPGHSAFTAAFVYYDGRVYANGSIVYDINLSVRPALKINLSSVIFTSAAVGGKPGTVGANLSAATPPTAQNLKFTMEDSGITLDTVTPTFVDGRTITFSYAGATSGNTLSAIVMRNSDTLRYYGQLTESINASGDNITVTVPAATDFNVQTDTLQILVEEINGDNRTDFASVRRTIPIAEQPAPTNLTGIAVTTASNNDGKITGTTTAMEYSSDGGLNWHPCDEGETTGLASGSYQVRFAGRVQAGTAYMASPVMSVVVEAYVPPTTYQVAVISAGTGSSGGGQYAQGDTVHIQAGTPPSGQQFKEWQITPSVTFVNNTSETSPDAEFTMPAAAVTATAVFEPIPPGNYLITVSHTGNGVANANVQSAPQGTLITLTATADSGWVFREWQVISGGITLSSTTTATATFTMPNNAVEITAVFARVLEENLTVIESPDKWTGSGDARWRITGAGPEQFVRLLHGGADGTPLIRGTDFIVTDGSTIITLREGYIKTLSNGTHNFRAEFTNDRYVNLTLVVEVPAVAGETAPTPTADSGIPRTGDDARTNLWLLLLGSSVIMLSGLVLFGTTTLKRKKNAQKKGSSI